MIYLQNFTACGREPLTLRWSAHKELYMHRGDATFAREARTRPFDAVNVKSAISSLEVKILSKSNSLQFPFLVINFSLLLLNWSQLFS